MKNKILSFIIIYLISYAFSMSQNMNWELTNGPPGANIFAVYKKNHEIITTNYNSSVWISSDDGLSWNKTNYPPGTGLDVLRFGNILLVGNYRSSDNGATWQWMSGFTIPSGENHTIKRFTFDGTTIYSAGMFDSRIHISSDLGDNWQDVTYNLHHTSYSIQDMILIDSLLYVAEWADGIYCRNINDTIWETRNIGLQLGVNCLLGKDNSMYAGTSDSGIYFSADRGLHWTPEYNGLSSRSIICLGANDSFVFAGTSRGLFRSIINSHVWTEVQSIPRFFSYTRLYVSNDTIFAGTNSYGLVKSYDGGLSWSTVYEVSHSISILCMTTSNDYIFVAAENGFFRTEDMGITWEVLSGGCSFNALFYNNNYLYSADILGGVNFSHDNGTTWIYSAVGLTSPVIGKKFEAIDSTIFLVKDYLYKSIDHGASWIQVPINIANEHVSILCRKGNDLYVGTGYKLFKSSDGGISWSQVMTLPPNIYFVNIVATNTSLFINGYSYILQSTDDGITWQVLPHTGLPGFDDFNYISALNNGLYAYLHSYGPYGDDIFHGLYKYHSGSWEFTTNAVPNEKSFLEYKGYIYGGVWAGLVRVTDYPSSPIAANKTICTGSTASLSASGIGTLGWYTAAIAGTYLGGGTNFITPILTVSTTFYVQDSTLVGSSTRTPVLVTVNPSPPAAPGASNTTICSGSKALLSAVGIGILGWYTSATVGTYVGGGSNFISPILISNTTYYVQDSTCSSSTTRTEVHAIVNSLPTITSATSDTVVCQGTSVILTGAGAISYTWSGGVTDGLAFFPTSTTIYTVTGTDVHSCSNTQTKTIFVNPLPIVTTNTSIDSVCLGTSVILIGTGAISYIWSGGITNGVDFAPSSTNTYTVTGTDGNDCSNIAESTIIIKPLPDVATHLNGVTITAKQYGATYQWLDCNNENSQIAVATNQSYTAPTNGDYSVIVSMNGCLDTSSCVNLNSTGIDETVKINNQLSVYPNPSDCILTIQSSSIGIYSLINEIGQTIKLFELNITNNYTINIENISNGIYFIVGYNNNNQMSRQKVVITK